MILDEKIILNPIMNLSLLRTLLEFIDIALNKLSEIAIGKAEN
jgi:hypothetical protein